jgi:hypothetical protein
MTYAQKTSVTPEKSQAEIQSVLERYGAGRFGTMKDLEKNRAYVMFVFRGLQIQMEVPLPNKNDKKYAMTEHGRTRSAAQMLAEYEQDSRQRWRALLLAIRAKLEAVETGISTIEQEFMAFIVLPDGKNVSEHLLPQLRKMTEDHQMPKLITGTV